MFSPARGAILRCYFPFETNPCHPGPFQHFCLFSNKFDVKDKSFFVVAYGTSKMDFDLMNTHSLNGGILSVDSQFIKGDMPGKVTHFLARHIALVPASFFNKNFKARLDFIRPEQRKNDKQRQHLYRQFEKFEEVLYLETEKSLNYFLKSGQIGLLPGKVLRKTSF